MSTTINFLYSEMEHADRLKMLASMAITRETLTFQRSLTELELQEERDRYAREAMRLTSMEEEFKKVKENTTAQIKAVKKTQETRLEVIASEARQVTDEVFLIPDMDQKQVLYVDRMGEIVNRREMRPEERQGRLMMLDKPEGNGKSDFITDVETETDPPMENVDGSETTEETKKSKRGRKHKTLPE